MSEPALQSSPASAPTAENPGKLVQASSIAAPYQEAVKAATAAREAAGLRKPKLVGILATPSPPSIAYAEWTRKACEAVGIEFEIWRTWDDAPAKEDGAEKSDADKAQQPDLDLEADVEDLIIAANADESVQGIMVSTFVLHPR